ncbi:MAG: chemotaxis protein CheW [Zetaproteobacteria bacterium]|nr:chemotaxis protein CheW [Zetaproteobacteria bacterium]
MIDDKELEAYFGLNWDGKPGTHYVRFMLGQNQLAIEAAIVSNIRELPITTHIPGLPPYVLGVSNQLGNVVPIIDLRIKLALPLAYFNQERPMLLLVAIPDAMDASRKRLLGFVVDQVEALCFVRDEEKKTANKKSLHLELDPDYIIGKVRQSHLSTYLFDIVSWAQECVLYELQKKLTM